VVQSVRKMASLKRLISFGMRDCINSVDESTLDEKHSTVTIQVPDDGGVTRQRIYWNDKIFSDATMKEEDVKKLKKQHMENTILPFIICNDMI